MLLITFDKIQVKEIKNELPKHMDFKDNSLSKSDDTTDSHFVFSAKNIVMEPLPKHMDALGNLLPEQPPSNLNNIGLGADLLLQYGNINNDVRKVLEWPITSRSLMGYGLTGSCYIKLSILY